MIGKIFPRRGHIDIKDESVCKRGNTLDGDYSISHDENRPLYESDESSSDEWGLSCLTLNPIDQVTPSWNRVVPGVLAISPSIGEEL